MIGFTTVLFELHQPAKLGLGWPCILIGFTLLGAHFLLKSKRSSLAVPAKPVPATQKKTEPAPPEFTTEDSTPVLASSKSISFVAPVLGPEVAANPGDAVLKTLTPDILNIRFLTYRCEISEQGMRAIYPNASQRGFKWYEIAAITIRQMPNQQPWEGKLILDIVPNAMPKEKVQPIRISSTTFVNYSALPQGQSASTRENMRRLAVFALSKHRLIFLDPGTDYFVHAGQPPVRFVSMAQFREYDSRF